MSDDPLAEFRQGYKTLSERAEERKAQAQARHRLEQSRPLTDGPEGAPEPRYMLWFCADGRRKAWVKCPSRSGAKIFLCEQHGWGDKHITVTIAETIPAPEEILTATFRTVLQANADDGYRSKK
jgi:hypothetical protein